MTDKVPFHCQWDLVAGELPAGLRGLPWPRAGCAIACATMVLEHHGCDVTMTDVLSEAIAAGAFDPVRFWKHAQLVAMLRGHGLHACRRNWRLLDGREAEYLAGRPLDAGTAAELAFVRRQMLAEGLWTIGGLLAAGHPVIVSVRRPSGETRTPGHQVLLVEQRDGLLVHHDPAERDGAGRTMTVEAFLSDWKGTAILVTGMAGWPGHAGGEP
jgi:hypothetical protein